MMPCQSHNLQKICPQDTSEAHFVCRQNGRLHSVRHTVNSGPLSLGRAGNVNTPEMANNPWVVEAASPSPRKCSRDTFRLPEDGNTSTLCKIDDSRNL
jgi:hypothetical protein